MRTKSKIPTTIIAMPAAHATTAPDLFQEDKQR